MSSPKIYAVDDEPENLDLYRRALPEYEFVGFTDPVAALTAILDDPPACVLADHRMPGMSGVELVTQARIGGFEGPVVMVTAFAELDEISYAEQVNLIYRVVPKPIQPDRFKEQVALAVAESRFRQTLEGARRHPRFDVKLPVAVAEDADWKDLTTHDVGMGGLLLAWEPAPAPESVRLRLEYGGERCEALGRVVRVSAKGTAIAFVDPSPEFRRMIGSLIIEHRFGMPPKTR